MRSALAVNDDLAVGRMIQSAYNVQKRGLAASRRSQDGDKLTFGKRNVHSLKHVRLVFANFVVFADVFQPEHSHSP